MAVFTVINRTPCLLPLQLCLPKGLQLRTQKVSLEAVFHPFLITREDGSRCYGFSYTFYEQVNSTKICTALHSLQVGVG